VEAAEWPRWLRKSADGGLAGFSVPASTENRRQDRRRYQSPVRPQRTGGKTAGVTSPITITARFGRRCLTRIADCCPKTERSERLGLGQAMGLPYFRRKAAKSTTRQLYPHSLSYQETTFARLPPTTFVRSASTMELLELCSMSVETTGSSV
jgi:hypothetical protein